MARHEIGKTHRICQELVLFDAQRSVCGPLDAPGCPSLAVNERDTTDRDATCPSPLHSSSLISNADLVKENWRGHARFASKVVSSRKNPLVSQAILILVVPCFPYAERLLKDRHTLLTSPGSWAQALSTKMTIIRGSDSDLGGFCVNL